ncbi:hypothetical protein VCJ_001042 [Vibrio metoecus]|nr:hypothetical protein VCJ_001042 [Vibrio metoecus]
MDLKQAAKDHSKDIELLEKLIKEHLCLTGTVPESDFVA